MLILTDVDIWNFNETALGKNVTSINLKENKISTQYLKTFYPIISVQIAIYAYCMVT